MLLCIDCTTVKLYVYIENDETRTRKVNIVDIQVKIFDLSRIPTEVYTIKHPLLNLGKDVCMV